MSKFSFFYSKPNLEVCSLHIISELKFTQYLNLFSNHFKNKKHSNGKSEENESSIYSS